jgi:anti-sigma regulatory factor (Ser/Thr protein kinase)
MRDIEVSTDNSGVEEVAAFVAALAREAGLAAAKEYWLRLAAEEIAVNVAQHGYCGRGPVRLVSGVAPDSAWLRIEDCAPPFDPGSHDPGPRLAATPAGGAAGGYGLLLALHKLDGFRYKRVGGRNHSTLIMCRQTVPGDAVPPGRAPARPAGALRAGGVQCHHSER